jgi:lincosamide nucleotidyltransferase A/C/D/E
MDDVDRIGATFGEYARDDSEWPSSFVLRDDAARKIDCHPLTFDENGDGWQANRTGGPPYRWPREGLAGRGRIGGFEVHCITPELQLPWHTYPEFDDVDWQDVTLLAERFALRLPPQLQRRPGFVAEKRAGRPSREPGSR